MRVLEWLGALMLAGGSVGFVYFAGFFDVSVETGSLARDYGAPQRVVNLGLLHQRNVGIGLSVVAAIAGAVLLGIGHVAVTKASMWRCPFCDMPISPSAVICPHCRQHQPGKQTTMSQARLEQTTDQVDQWYQDQERGDRKTE